MAACGHRDAGRVTLTPTSLYNIDSVRLAIGSGATQTSPRLAAAVALYKNKQLYAQAADSLKAVIYAMPSARAYYELGSALLMGKQYEESIEALRVAEQLQYAPLSSVLYKLSAAYVNYPGPDGNTETQHDSLAVLYMQVALQMGYPNPEKFLKDTAFKRLSVYNPFKEAYYEAMAGREDPKASIWKDFLAGFAPLPLPVTIDTAWVKTHDESKMGNIDFSYEKFITEMRTARFARGDEPGYFYVGKVKEDTNYIALIYGGTFDWGDMTEPQDPGDSTTSGRPTYPFFFYLTTYSHQGKIIDKIMIAGQESTEKTYKMFSMDAGLGFSVTDLALTYATDPSTTAPGADTVTGAQVVALAHYRINILGKFEKVDGPPMAMR
jgi:hypothetical protein